MKTALAFSGGKDSWACLLMNRHRLDEITVLWVNPGKTYPEILETIELARAMCPHFIEIASDRDAQNAAYGIPSDVVPIDWTLLGQSMTSIKPVAVQPYIFCCYSNMVQPLMAKCAELGITHLIRGQRNAEGHRGGAKDGDVVAGIIMVQPIEDWTKQEVLDYVATHMELPDHFRFAHSSMDCYDCTAYGKESADRIEYTRQKYPNFHSEYMKRRDLLNGAIREALHG